MRLSASSCPILFSFLTLLIISSSLDIMNIFYKNNLSLCREVVPVNYVTYSDLFTFVLVIIVLLTYLNNRNNKHKNNCPLT